MNRALLTKATSTDDGRVPDYVMKEICDATYQSARDAEKMADFLLRRLQKSNLNTKIKTLAIIQNCTREGDAVFAEVVQENLEEVKKMTEFSGPPDPIYGEERYRQIRLLAQEAMDALYSAKSQQNKASQPANSFNAVQSQPMYSQDMRNGQQYASQGLVNQEYPNYDQQQQQQQQQQYIPEQHNTSQVPHGTAAHGNPIHSYGEQIPTYNSNSTEPHNPLPPSQLQPTNTTPCTTYESSFKGSWSRGKRSTGMGVWGSAGYQKNAANSNPSPVFDTPNSLPENSYPPQGTGNGSIPSYPMESGPSGASRVMNARDNRPTVLASQNKQGWKQRMSTKFSSGNPPPSGSQAPMGAGQLSGGGLVEGKHDNKFGSKMSRLKHKANHELQEAKGKWYGRKMDKSVTTSLAANDTVSNASTAGGAVYTPNMVGGTGGGDTSGEYERALISNLCPAGGLSRTPPPDGLARFVDLAKTLDVDLIGEILREKLEDTSWQVRLKALYVVEALLDANGCAQYGEWFEENPEAVERTLYEESKRNVRAKAFEVLLMLGLVDEDQREEFQSAPAPRARTTRATAPRQSRDVDILGFGDLSVQDNASALPCSPPPAPVYDDDDDNESALDFMQQSASSAAPTSSSMDPFGLDAMMSNSNANGAPDFFPSAPPVHHPSSSNPPQVQTNDNGQSSTRGTRSLSDVGKDLFNVATSPHPNSNSASFTSSQSAQRDSESAFDFLSS